MENFDWTRFTRKIAVKASVKQLYDAWTIPQELEKWFLKRARFFDQDHMVADDANIKAGSRYEWEWYLYDGIEKGSVKVANGNDHLQFTFAGDCIVDINLEDFEGITIVSITQRNIPETEEAKRNIRLGCDSGWSFYLVNLKSVYEGGLDLRNKDARLKPMLNN